LEFFYKTNDLLIIDAEISGKDFYAPEEIKKDKGNTSYYRWLSVFNKICEQLQIDEKELLDIYLKKVEINQQRTQEK
jgi:dimeric dUTPase (all-alpha-NTP-PPase superfamily)